MELLSSAMYVDPLSVYREYIQNAVDSLDDASEAGLRPGNGTEVEITLNPNERSATIRDLGVGISEAKFARTLTAIGGSHKRGTPARGFRGVGRLAGLGYCQELVMRSKSSDDDHVTAMYWDCKRLKELLADPAEMELEMIFAEAVTMEKIPAGSFPRHFFEVEMRNIGRYKNDVLLNDAIVSNYLSQIAPVPFSPTFSFGKNIQEFLEINNAGKCYAITLNGEQLFRRFGNQYEAKPNVYGKFSEPEFFEIPALATGTAAVGWILHSDYLGAIPERHGIHGLRLRAGNVQIGDARVLDSLYKQPRFNAWAVGECHVTSSKIVPNARRDDFEQNNHYSNLLTHLTPKATAILKACRDRSAERTRGKRDRAVPNSVQVNWTQAKGFFSKNHNKRITKAHKSYLSRKLKNGGLTYLELMSLFATVSNC